MGCTKLVISLYLENHHLITTNYLVQWSTRVTIKTCSGFHLNYWLKQPGCQKKIQGLTMTYVF